MAGERQVDSLKVRGKLAVGSGQGRGKLAVGRGEASLQLQGRDGWQFAGERQVCSWRLAGKKL